MMLRIEQSYYYYGNLRGWIQCKKSKCAECIANKPVPLVKPPPATINSTRPFQRIVVDYTEIGHTDVLTGAISARIVPQVTPPNF